MALKKKELTQRAQGRSTPIEAQGKEITEKRVIGTIRAAGQVG
jgi:hypothetical protein